MVIKQTLISMQLVSIQGPRTMNIFYILCLKFQEKSRSTRMNRLTFGYLIYTCLYIKLHATIAIAIALINVLHFFGQINKRKGTLQKSCPETDARSKCLEKKTKRNKQRQASTTKPPQKGKKEGNKLLERD